MSKKLAIVAVSGLVIGVACMAAAAAIGGRGLSNGAFDRILDNIGIGEGETCHVAQGGRQDERSLDWDGNDEVSIEIPANVHYQRGQGDKLVLKGDAALLPLVRLQDGRIRLTCHLRRFHDRLEVTLPGRDFRSYSIKGSGDVSLEGIDQPSLEINVAGASDVTASGKTDKLQYNLAGSGNGKFADLEARSAEITIAGSGDTDVNPKDNLEVNIAGSGDVRLHSEPQHLETSIFGSGEIVHANGEVSRTHGVGSMSHGAEVPEPPPPPASPVPPAPAKPAKPI